ncbi:hypothetical protein POM88_018341 [Heracleum sosnowskyi]|uniref:Uncharacterized protein n=1 Tax=Heracleum sosnowskyi TaxID=360622 RepID=A0AAD8ISC6_9APIA|nr:hypothetical protein POM88_018341 [Heracleum sosnowskyi]
MKMHMFLKMMIKVEMMLQKVCLRLIRVRRTQQIQCLYSLLHKASGSGTNTDRVPETDMPFFENEEVEPETIKKKLNSSKGFDGIEKLVSGGKKSHGPGWLIGRHDASLIKTSTQAPAPTDSYIEELTKKIRQDLVADMEAKLEGKVNEEVDAKVNQKVQDNLAIVLKKLAEANPSL